MARRSTPRARHTAAHRSATPPRTPSPRLPGVRPDPRLGQNFLVDPAARRMVLRAVGDPPDLVVEVGAGHGALTRSLARATRELVAYEIDPRLIAPLRESVRGLDNVTCVRGDFLHSRAPSTPFAVVGNIPYNRSTDIVRWCLRARHLTAATLLTQREFTQKHTGAYGRWTQLSVLAWPRFELAATGRVAPRAFRPAPRVDSAVLLIRRREQPLVAAEHARDYEALVRLGFTGAGGSLEASLSRDHSTRAVRRALTTAGVARGTAVGFVSPTQWVTLFTSLRAHG
ncbi:23S ribosomal RNA methyltransferase Erm [Spiractinospora alimapuensis]|uniref:23S ribosomal RNA methyltransferase Erm n=1 Tax=Spiractinospora alimapuensis TaxID=2820884 RepID=UPI001EEA29DE|nr:23S ribosomal RNA methyltransferase Erm [Spiractinospora alimapuensis]QVQ52887.1 23S ribosomal RNA methyltransferase Erm [Spiractinospora alimapuensis]